MPIATITATLHQFTFEDGEIQSVYRVSIALVINHWRLATIDFVRLAVARDCGRCPSLNQNHLVSVLSLKVVKTCAEVEVADGVKRGIVSREFFYHLWVKLS